VYAGSALATDETLPADARHLSVRPVLAQESNFTAWLRHAIYHERTVPELLIRPLIVSGIYFCLLLVFGIVYDAKRLSGFRQGRKVRGPDQVSRSEFNRMTKGDGLAFTLENARTPMEFFQGAKGKQIRIEKRHEPQHFQAIGDPGTGKTQAILQILDQAEANGETAIICDPTWNLRAVTTIRNAAISLPTPSMSAPFPGVPRMNSTSRTAPQRKPPQLPKPKAYIRDGQPIRIGSLSIRRD
jgi:hypothetical protein